MILLTKLMIMGITFSGFDSKNWVVTQSWVNQKNSNEKHHLHNHTNSMDFRVVIFLWEKRQKYSFIKFF